MSVRFDDTKKYADCEIVQSNNNNLKSYFKLICLFGIVLIFFHIIYKIAISLQLIIKIQILLKVSNHLLLKIFFIPQ